VPSPDVSLFSAHGQKPRPVRVVFHPKMMLANLQREGLASAGAVAHHDNGLRIYL
jgi:hypothetical protein